MDKASNVPEQIESNTEQAQPNSAQLNLLEVIANSTPISSTRSVESSAALPVIELIGADYSASSFAPRGKASGNVHSESYESDYSASSYAPRGRATAIHQNETQEAQETHEGITKEELAKVVQDPSTKGTYARQMAAIYYNFDSLSNLSGTHTDSVPTVSSKDLDAYEQKSKKLNDDFQTGSLGYQWLSSNLTKFAADKEKMTLADIENSLKSTNLDEGAKTILGLLQNRFEEIASNYGIPFFGTKAIKPQDLYHFAETAAESPDGEMVGKVQQAMERTANAQQENVSKELYSDGIKSIQPDAIKQGMIGDCYFEAVLASAAANDPKLIQNAIKDNNDGTFTVSFPGATEKPITVSSPTEAELGLYNGASERGVWASVMEKAFGELKQIESNIKKNLPQEGADGGGHTEEVIELLTGNPAQNHGMANDSAKVMNDLSAAFLKGEKKIATASVGYDFLNLIGMGTDESKDNFARRHAYSILDYSNNILTGPMVTVRNPWGEQDGTTRGTIEISLKKFMENFDYYTIQK